MKTSRLLIVVLMVLGLTGFALADDFQPPEFRGDPLSVMVEWDFKTDFTPNLMDIRPDQLNVVGDGVHPLGDAYTHAHATQSVFWQVDPDDPQDGRAYTLEQPGQIDFFLVNWTDPYPYKHIWIQITYGGEGVPFVSEVVGPNPGTNTWTDPTYGQPVDNFPVDPIHRIEYWVLQPNPDREHIYLEIPPFTWVDQIVIDTVSTPSPVTVEQDTWGGIKALYR